MTASRFSVLDEFFLQVERPHLPTHWALVFDLGSAIAGRRGEVGVVAGDALDVESLRLRVAQRVAAYPAFTLGAVGGFGTRPELYSHQGEAVASCVRSAEVDDDDEWVGLLSRLLAEPLDRDRPSWRLITVQQRDPRRARVVLLVHHAMSDGIAGAGYTGLFVDGDAAGLRQLDRYLRADRFAGPQMRMGGFLPAAGNVLISWARGLRSSRLPRVTAEADRRVAAVELPTADVRRAAGRLGVGTTEFLVAAVGKVAADAVREYVPEASRPDVLRAFVPATLDRELSHSGNAVSMVLVNLDGGGSGLAERAAAARGQLSAVSTTGAALALPMVSRAAGVLPWTLNRLATRSTMAALRPDLHVGVNPAHLHLRTVLGRPITGIQPLSPLLGNSVSFTCLVVGRSIHVGIVWDPNALGGDFGVESGSALDRLITSESIAF